MTTNKPVELGKASQETKQVNHFKPDGDGHPFGDKIL
jgi:hypothetical protein